MWLTSIKAKVGLTQFSSAGYKNSSTGTEGTSR
jgi:hypothetical protein